MSAFVDPTFSASDRPRERIPPTMDLESTTDLTGDHTTDLAPVTNDTDRAEISAEMPFADGPAAGLNDTSNVFVPEGRMVMRIMPRGGM